MFTADGNIALIPANHDLLAFIICFHFAADIYGVLVHPLAESTSAPGLAGV